MHYKRLIKHGTVDIPERPKTLEEAFLRRITKGENGCWNWDGINKSGYGDLRFRGARMYAHRYAWERANGPIPDDMEVNHRCWNRACVNVEHLEVVTRSQNASYLDGPRVDNQSGYRNVSRNRNGWVARVNKNGVRYRGTTRKTIEGAIADAKHLREKLLGAHAGNG